MSGFTGNIQLVYVLAAACFVGGLHLMNSPATARRGNQVSTAGMVIAGVATLILMIHDGTVTATGWIVLISGALIGSAVGLYAAQGVQLFAAHFVRLPEPFRKYGYTAIDKVLTKGIAGNDSLGHSSVPRSCANIHLVFVRRFRRGVVHFDARARFERAQGLVASGDDLIAFLQAA